MCNSEYVFGTCFFLLIAFATFVSGHVRKEWQYLWSKPNEAHGRKRGSSLTPWPKAAPNPRIKWLMTSENLRFYQGISQVDLQTLYCAETPSMVYLT